MRVGVAVVCLLLGCSAGDLTLPGSAEPVKLDILSGDGQRADPGTLLPRPLVVELLDADSNPVPGGRVEFGFLGDVPGAGVDPALATTGEDGRAEAFVRLGTESGEQLIVARVVGTVSPDLSARFRVIAKDGEDGGGGGDDDDGDDDDGNSGPGGGDDDGSGDDSPDVGSPPDPLPIGGGQYPPEGSCRVWIPWLSAGQQAPPTGCAAAESGAPAGTWVLYSPAVIPEIHVRVIHPDRSGLVVRVWIYDQAGRLLREEDRYGATSSGIS
jgi:hypothetical protein